MIYGTPQILVDDDTTDRIGVRHLVLSQMWQPPREGLSQVEIDAARPGIPSTPGGVLLIGTQTRRAGGVYKTSWTFEGIEGDGKGVTFRDRTNSMDYGFDPSFSQLPIELFPTFQDLMQQYGGSWDDADSKVIWPASLPSNTGTTTSGLGGGSQAKTTTNPLFGRQEFFSITGHYRFRYASLQAPSQAGAGYIATKLPGQPPTIGKARNWLFTGAPFKRRGLIFDITEIYWLSEDGGWPAPIYKNQNASGDGTGSYTSIGGGGPTDDLASTFVQYAPAP